MNSPSQRRQPLEALEIKRNIGNAAQLVFGRFETETDETSPMVGLLKTDSGAIRIEFQTDELLTTDVAGFAVPLAFEIQAARPRSRYYIQQHLQGFSFMMDPEMHESRPHRTKVPGLTTLWVRTFPMIAIESIDFTAYGRIGITNSNIKKLTSDIDRVAQDAIADWARWDFDRRHVEATSRSRTAAVRKLMNALNKQMANRERSIDLAQVAHYAREARAKGEPTSRYVAAEMGLYSTDPMNYARNLIHQARHAGLDVGDGYAKGHED